MAFELIIFTSQLVLLLLHHVHGCPFLDSKDASVPSALKFPEGFHRNLRSNGVYTPGVCAKTNGAKAIENDANICSAYRDIAKDFSNIIPSTPIEQANLYGAAVRLAFHDAGEIDVTNSTDKMGPDGCLSSSSDNAGLVEDTSLVNTVIEPMWQAHCDKISRADFWVLFAKLSLEYSDPTKSIQLSYQYGRQDKTVCEPNVERLPDAQYGMEMLQKVFVNQMGLTITDAVTLLGAHTLGHVHIDNSGYGLDKDTEDFSPCGETVEERYNCLNAWTYNPHEFDNSFYSSLFLSPWDNKQPDGPNKNVWVLGSNSIMLNTDMVVAFNITFTTENLSAVGQQCGPYPGGVLACTMPDAPTSRTFDTAYKYYQDNSLFLTSFAQSFNKMTTVGYSSVGQGPKGKLGALTSIDLSTC